MADLPEWLTSVATADEPQPTPTGDIPEWLTKVAQPVATDPLSEAVTRERQFPSGGLPYALERVPFFGTGFAARRAWDAKKSAERIKAGDGRASDFSALAEIIVEHERLKARSPWKQTVDLITSIPAFAVEFGVTGSAYSAVAKIGTRGALRGAAGQSAKWAARAGGVAAQTAANPGLVARSVAETALQHELEGDDASFAQSLWEGTLSSYIELGSERTGAGIGKTLGNLPGIKRLREAVSTAWLKKFPNMTTSDLARRVAQQGGWNGILGEIGEERVGEIARGLTGLDTSYGATGRLFDPETRPEALRQLAVEAGAFGALGGGIAAADILLGASAELFVKQNPQAAQAIASTPQPSRTQLQAAGITGETNAAQRATISGIVGSALQAQQQATQPAAPETPAAPTAPAAKPTPTVQPVPAAPAAPAAQPAPTVQMAAAPPIQAQPLEPTTPVKVEEQGIPGSTLRHFTTAESKAQIESSGQFDITKPPVSGVSGIVRETRTGEFAGNRIYLSLDDAEWSKTVRRTAKSGRILESTEEAAKLGGEPFYDYDKRKLMVEIGAHEPLQLHPVEFVVNANARILTIDSKKSLLDALEEAGRREPGPEMWDDLAKTYDAVAIKNVRQMAGKGVKFFKHAKSDQLVVLNPNAVRLVLPQSPSPERTSPTKPSPTVPAPVEPQPAVQPESAITETRVPESQLTTPQQAVAEGVAAITTETTPPPTPVAPVPVPEGLALTPSEQATIAARRVEAPPKQKVGRRKKASVLTPQPVIEQATRLVAEEAERARIEESPEVVGGGAGAIGGVAAFRQRPTIFTEADYAPSRAEVKEAILASKETDRPTLIQKAVETAKEFGAYVTRPQRHLPNTEEYAVFNEFFRLLREVGSTAADEVQNRIVPSIVERLSPDMIEVMMLKLVYENQLHALDLAQPLRYRFESREEVLQERNKIDALIARPEAEPIRTALANREAIRRDVVGKLVQHDLIKPEALENPAYFHMRIQALMDFNRFVTGGTKARPTRRGFQKRRVKGEELPAMFDPQANYIESEIEWMTQALIEIGKEELRQKLPDQMPEIKQQVTDLNRQALQQLDQTLVEVLDAMPFPAQKNAFLEEKLGSDYMTVRRLLNERYPDLDMWQPRPGNYLYKAFSIPEQIAEKIKQYLLDDLNLTPEQIREVLAIGGERPSMVLPNRVVAQLDLLEKQPSENVVSKASRFLVILQKMGYLMSPRRITSYLLRQTVGDLDPVFGGYPGVLRPKYVIPAIKDAWDLQYGKLALREPIRTARGLGVMSSTLTAQEIPDIQDIPVFRRFYKQQNKTLNPLAWSASWFQFARKFVTFRESITRQAAFLYFRDNINNLTYYGPEKKEVVLAIREHFGRDEAAAHMARKLVGDYGDVTELTRMARAHAVPFASFEDVNTRRYYRMFINTIANGEYSRAPLVATGAAVVTAARLLLLASPLALFLLWNHTVMDDIEDELSPEDKIRAHVNLGRNPDGSLIIFRNPLSLPNMLEWLGLHELPAMLREYEAGQRTIKEILLTILGAPWRKLYDMSRAEVKLFSEAIVGQSHWPHFFQPRPVRRDEALARATTLGEEYRWAKGWTMKEGTRPQQHYWQRWIFGVSDPRQNALTEIHSARDQFLRIEGKERPQPVVMSRISNMRRAAMDEDQDAFFEAKRAFVQRGGTYDYFKRSMQYVDPIGRQLNSRDEWKFEHEFLTREQRKVLKLARDYAFDVKVRMLEWWIIEDQLSQK